MGESLAALRRVFANRDLRRLQVAWFGSSIGDASYFLAVSVFAFEVGGAGAVGVAAVARMVPAAIAMPFAAALADRHARQRVMVASDLLRAAGLAVAAVTITIDAPAVLTIALVAVAGVLSTPFEPAKSALLPELAETPEELTAANLVSSTIESVTLFLGPALAGAVLAVWGTEAALLVSVTTLLWSAWFVGRIRGRAPKADSGQDEETSTSLGVAEGLRAVRSDSRLLVICGLVIAQLFVFGALSVLTVVLAINLLGLGDGGVGYLYSAVGVGALIGAAATLGLVGGRRLGRGLAIGIAFWGLPLVAIGLVVSEPLVIAMMVALGIANTVVDVTSLSLMQRIAPEEVLARVFGVLETGVIVALALGNLAAPLLIDVAGPEAAFVTTGAVLPVLALLSWRSLRAIDAESPAPTRELELLEGVPLFRPLGPAALEELAARATFVRFGDGERIVTQGDAGKRFYVIADGSVSVAVDGAHVRDQGPGDHFGEIALLREVPRTATVTAVGSVELLALDRADFLDAVTGHPRSSAAAEAVIGARLARARPASAAT